MWGFLASQAESIQKAASEDELSSLGFLLCTRVLHINCLAIYLKQRLERRARRGQSKAQGAEVRSAHQ